MAKQISKTCRTCLGNNGKLLSIYNEEENRIGEMLEYILDTRLEVTDGLPQKVCHECFKDISHCYSFKIKCNKSFEFLRNLLDKRKQLPEVVMQIKVEPDLNILHEVFKSKNELQNTLDATRRDLTNEEMGQLSTKAEPIELTSASDVNYLDKANSIRKLGQSQMLTKQQLELYEKDIISPTITATVSNDQVDGNDNHYDHFQNQNNGIDVQTVQYLIRELNEDRNSVDELLEVEVNIRYCASCGSGFAQHTDFNEHLRNCGQSKQMNVIQKTPSKRKKHLCPYCDKVFPRPCRLKNHLRKHPEAIELKEAAKTPNKYKCSHCDLSFNLESSLKYHLSSHQNEKQLNRSFYEQSLQKRLNLNVHLTTHTNPKRHKCKNCHKEFEWSSQLKIHMLDHKAKYFYVCKLCPKQFTYEKELTMHSIQVHNDEKPFKCKFCGTGFTEKYNLNYHQQYVCKSK